MLRKVTIGIVSFDGKPSMKHCNKDFAQFRTVSHNSREFDSYESNWPRTSRLFRVTKILEIEKDSISYATS